MENGNGQKKKAVKMKAIKKKPSIGKVLKRAWDKFQAVVRDKDRWDEVSENIRQAFLRNKGK